MDSTTTTTEANKTRLGELADSLAAAAAEASTFGGLRAHLSRAADFATGAAAELAAMDARLAALEAKR